jgi:hypothetical protein
LAKKLKTSHSTIERYLREMGMQFSENRWIYSHITREPPSQSFDLNRHASNNNQSVSFESQPTSISNSTSLSQTSVTEEQNYDQSASCATLAGLSQTSTTEEQNYDQSDADNWMIEFYSGFI